MRTKARLEHGEHGDWILCDECPDPEYCFQEVEAVDEDGEHLSSGYPCYLWGDSTGPECEHLREWKTDPDGTIWITCDSECWNE